MVQIVGKYQYMSSENFEDYIKSLGKADLADAFLQATPVVEIQQNGEQWIVVVTSQGKTVTATFKLGEVYDEQLPSQGLVFKVGYSFSYSFKKERQTKCEWGRRKRGKGRKGKRLKITLRNQVSYEQSHNHMNN